MKTRVVAAMLIAVLTVILVAGALGAAPPPPPTVARHLFSSGGQPIAGGAFRLNGSLGEPIAGVLTMGAPGGLRSGFWWSQGARAGLPLILRRH